MQLGGCAGTVVGLMHVDTVQRADLVVKLAAMCVLFHYF